MPVEFCLSREARQLCLPHGAVLTFAMVADRYMAEVAVRKASGRWPTTRRRWPT